MVIVENCSKDMFNKKVSELKKRANDPNNVCFSVGSFHNSSGSDIRYSMRIADEAMYKEFCNVLQSTVAKFIAEDIIDYLEIPYINVDYKVFSALSRCKYLMYTFIQVFPRI